MSRTTAMLLVLALWAAIYLPGLGSTELRGEEPRRIFPAIAMIETGDWLVPRLAGEPYLRKPPLVNWLIAASFQATGLRNEWTARLPSALAVLMLGLIIVGLAREGDWLTREKSVVLAALAMLNFGLLAKARLVGAEIEGVFVPLSQIAVVVWMAWWAQRRSPWLLWVVPFVFLGLACLAKGPNLHLVVFYVLVIAVLWRAGELKTFVHPAHLLGLLIGAAIFGAWAWPFYHSPEARNAFEVLKGQGVSRFTESEIAAGSYFLNIPKGLIDALPALLLTPAIWASLKRSGREEGDRRMAALMIGSAITFAFCFALLLIPGMLPRYILPAGILLAVLAAVSREWAWFHGVRWWKVVGGFTAVSLLYAFVIAPLMERRAKLRPFAAEVDAAVPAGETLFICDPEDDASKMGAAFYLRTPHRFAARVSDIPPDARWVLAHRKKRKKLPDARSEFVVAKTFFEGSGNDWLLFRKGG